MTYETLKKFAKFLKVKWGISSGAIRIAEPPDFEDEYVTLDWDIHPDDVREFALISGLGFIADTPTKPGWYWLKWKRESNEPSGVTLAQVRFVFLPGPISPIDLEVFTIGNDAPESMDKFTPAAYEWAGPLEPPT